MSNITSLEKSKIKILLLEGVHQSAVDTLNANGYENIEYHKGALPEAELLEKINSSLIQQNQEVFINVRTDTFLIGISNPIQETIERAKKYKNAGAGGLFVPCIVKEIDIAAVIENIDLPLNVMCMPNLPDFVTLQKLGVKRISMGGFVQSKLTKVLFQEL